METENNSSRKVIDALISKATLKQGVYSNTFNAFQEFKKVIMEYVEANKHEVFQANRNILLDYNDKGGFEAELKFGGDVLFFLMHTNIFEFSRDHEVMRTSYIREDSKRSYCGMITIYNFLADSFKYNRSNDIGYLIGRIFINNESHYFVEGKREIGLLYNNFATSVLNKDAVKQIVESAMMYTLNFDLLTPPYESMKEISVSEMQFTIDNMPIKTGKRLGFRFYADSDENI
jgi:hypothetical protein